ARHCRPRSTRRTWSAATGSTCSTAPTRAGLSGRPPRGVNPGRSPRSGPRPRAPISLRDSFVRWNGWSLSAPRPGRSLGVDPSGPDPDRPETMPQRTTNDPLTQAGLRIETRVRPRTLPRLRFGHRYQVRVRTVDLAGNGMDLATAN